MLYKIYACRINFNELFHNTPAASFVFLYIQKCMSLQEERIRRCIIMLIAIRVQQYEIVRALCSENEFHLRSTQLIVNKNMYLRVSSIECTAMMKVR